MRDYARQCDDVWDLQQKAAEMREAKLETEAESYIQHSLEDVLIEMVYTLEEDEAAQISKYMKGDKTMLGILMAKLINRTALSLAELGED